MVQKKRKGNSAWPCVLTKVDLARRWRRCFNEYLLQKYNSASGKYETLDKLDGLGMSSEEFSYAINQFFNDGLTYRSKLITPIIQKLTDYYSCISQQDSFRFYSSSLLIIYDGAPGQEHVNVRAIDFAHTIYPGIPVLRSESCGGPDEGYLRGIKSMIDLLSK